VHPTRLSRDTDEQSEQLQIDGWRAMSSSQKLALVSGASRRASSLAFTGLRQRYPSASARELFLRYAILTLGRDLARSAYPEIAGLD
jgi:hypothetical protein